MKIVETLSTSTAVKFLVPYSLTWDKLCALFIRIRQVSPSASFGKLISEGIIEVYFDGPNEPPEECVDVDVLCDYKRSGHGSATERAVQESGRVFPGLLHLVKLLNLNNATGSLKKQPDSFVTLIRDAYSEELTDEEKVGVVQKFWMVVQVYFLACFKDEATVVALENPFTRESFRRMCELAGVARATFEAIDASMEKLFEAAGRLEENARQEAGNVPPNIFEISTTKGGRAAEGRYIQVRNKKTAAKYLDLYPALQLLIVRDQRLGNVAIFCKGKQDFRLLYEALAQKEPGLWHLDTRHKSPMILNGSTSRYVRPSQITENELVKMAQQNFCCKVSR